jgi:hypothetical protein
MVPGRAVKKGKKGWDRWSSKKRGRGSKGPGKMIPVSTQDPRVNLESAAVAHCFPGCKSGELGVEPTCPSQILAPFVIMKELPFVHPNKNKD